MNQKLIVGSALAGALELVGHWFPWPQPLHRVGAYAYGVAAILTGVAVATDRKTTGKMAAVCAVAGIATVAAYIVDFHLKTRQRRRMYGSNG
jgi:hypothetical protein